MTSLIEKNFDRLALFGSDGWTHNNHYHDSDGGIQAAKGAGSGELELPDSIQLPKPFAFSL